MTPQAAGTGATPTVLTGQVVLRDRVVRDGAVVLSGDRIVHAGRRDDAAVPAGSVPVDLPAGVLLLPGLVDLHCHGGAGGEFGPDEASARRAAAHHHRHGSTSVVASHVSAPRDVLVRSLRTSAALAAEGVVAAVHAEGPFLSPLRRGAQDPEALTAVDLRLVDELAEAGAGHWAVMTFAPELDGAGDLVTRLAAHGVVPAVGHTDASAATTAQALAAVATALAGAAPPQRGDRPLVTHLFNGMPPLHHRRPGPAAAGLAAAARGEAVVELIADGVHLADETVAMVMAAAAPGAVALVTDAMAASGMAEGRYRLGRLDVLVAEGTARLADGTSIAGGVATLLDVVRRCVQRAGTPLAATVAAASATPARVLGLSGEVGALAPGLRADVLAVDGDLRPVAVWRAGQRLAPPAGGAS